MGRHVRDVADAGEEAVTLKIKRGERGGGDTTLSITWRDATIIGRMHGNP